MERSAKPLDNQKQETLIVEIFEIGKVSRCFGCASDETFDSIDSADRFRISTVRSFVFTVDQNIRVAVYPTGIM